MARTPTRPRRPLPLSLASDQQGVTHIIEFTMALTFFLFILQGFTEAIDYRLGPPLLEDNSRDVRLYNLVGHLLRSPGRIDNFGTNDTHWERYPPYASSADLYHNLTSLGFATEDNPSILSQAKVLALRNLSYAHVLTLLELSGSHLQIKVTLAGAPTPLIDWGADHRQGYRGSTLTRVRLMDNGSGLQPSQIEVRLFSGTYPQAQIQLSEVMYQPVGGFLNREWVELYNPSDNAVDLRDWKLTDGEEIDTLRATQGRGTLLAGGGYALVTTSLANLSYLRQLHSIPAATLYLRVNDNELASNGLIANQTLSLMDSTRQTIDTLSYEPGTSTGSNETLERIAFTTSAQDPSNWGVSLIEGGTPGRKNTLTL